jgi:methyl-accepting chemotaxis protein
LKENLFKAEQEYIKAIKNSETGALVSHESDGSYMVGYATMNAPKFVPKLGWSLIVKDDEAEVMAVFHRAQKIFYFVFGCVLVLAVFGSFWFSNDLSRRLSDLAVKLNQGSVEVASAAGSINTSSIELSEAATEQASAIQQTAASIDEVSAMVKKSADNATQSQKVSQSSREAAEGGQQAVTEMMHSIAEISQSNAAIMNQVEEGNRQISEIVKVIAEIGNKTKVINDIVFQTKLLSFNASVEAARAGEHGKGFAVVAEEVGNLAQMSGNAAKEISAMLEGSIQKVEGIVSETKSKVEKLVVDAKGKVESGTTVAKKCGESLSNILSTVQEVDGMVSEIASASNEQAQGVAEINKAMNQLDQVTQKNTSVAQQAATSSIQLTSQSTELRNMVQDLFYLVSGSTEGSSGAGKMSTKPEVSSYRVGNVVSMLPKKKTSEDSERPLKKAVGAGFEDSPSSLPSKDDPRFEDV